MKRIFAIFLLLSGISFATLTPEGGGGGGSGTVTSVAMTVPSTLLSISGSPITTSGTLAVTLGTRAANLVFAGPTTGSAAAPAFRALVAADLPALTSAHLFVGNGSNAATDVAVTGDISISNAGVVAIATGVIVNADVNASAAIAYSKLAALTSAHILVGSAGNVATDVAVSGDISLGNTGATAYSGVVPLLKGGTGTAAASANAAFNALSPMTTSGDIIYGGASGAATRLAKGSDGQALVLASGIPSWGTVAAGDFSGPASSVDNTVVRFDGTGGKTGQGSSLVVSDQATTSTLTLSMPDDAVNNSTKSADIVIRPADKTAGTGNGGDFYVTSGDSIGGLPGSVYVGAAEASNSTHAAKFLYISGFTQLRMPLRGDNTANIAFGTSSAVGIGASVNTLQLIGGNAIRIYIDGSTVDMVNDLIWSTAPNTKDIGATASSAFYAPRNIFAGTSVGIGIGAGAGSYSAPNYHLDIRQNTAATAVYSQFSIKTTTGNTSTDGTKVGLDASGNFLVNQQEALEIQFLTSGTAAWSIGSGGTLQNKVAANESTGGGSALLGSNSPASTLTAPYTWIALKTSDGSTVYMPVWK